MLVENRKIVVNKFRKKRISKLFEGEKDMKNIDELITEMESSNLLMSQEYTFTEYAYEIRQFQDMICKLIAGDAYHEGMRVDEGLFLMESIARKKELRNHPAVLNGILTMRKLVKEMAITMSGVNGEKLVSKTLEFLSRPNTQVFRNVYITDGTEETEIDTIVLTDNGVIILEIKKVKSDLTLTEDGRMVFAGDECYDKVPLAQKMEIKRRLLKMHLEKEIREKGMDIPVWVDSFIVFSAPAGQHINIDNKYRREKYCFRTNLNNRINEYIGCANYKKDQLEQVAEILSKMESNVKRFETNLNYDEVRHSLAEALVILQNDIANSEEIISEKKADENSDKVMVLDLDSNSNLFRRKYIRIGYAAASVLAGVLISKTAVGLGKSSLASALCKGILHT